MGIINGYNDDAMADQKPWRYQPSMVSERSVVTSNLHRSFVLKNWMTSTWSTALWPQWQHFSVICRVYTCNMYTHDSFVCFYICPWQVFLLYTIISSQSADTYHSSWYTNQLTSTILTTQIVFPPIFQHPRPLKHGFPSYHLTSTNAMFPTSLPLPFWRKVPPIPPVDNTSPKKHTTSTADFDGTTAQPLRSCCV